MLKLKTAATSEPIDATYYKAHLRISSDVTADDTYLANVAKACRQLAENIYNGAFYTQTWQAFFDTWDELEIWKQPVQSISSVAYYADTGTTLTTVSSTFYDVDLTCFPARIQPKEGNSWPSTVSRPGAIVVEFVAGWTDTTIPEIAKIGIVQLMRTIYDNPGDTAFVNTSQLPLASRVCLESVFKPGY